jgi:hypothetical protein
LKNIKISIFGGISKLFKLNVFGQILTKIGSFGQFWVDSATMAMADIQLLWQWLPPFERKKENFIIFAKKGLESCM